MSKQKQNQLQDKQERIQQIVMQTSVWVLTAAALMAATEKLHHIDIHHAATPGGYSSQTNAHAEPVKSERVKETPRIFEEYDVGLRMPAISGG